MIKKLLLSVLVAALMCLSQGIAGAADMPFKEADNALIPLHAIDNARDMLHLYPSGDTVVLPALSREEEQKIVDLIKDENHTYVAIRRDVSVGIDNWEFVGTKQSSDIWQLHIMSPDATSMQVFLYEATLFPGLDIKVYSGREGISSHIGEHRGNNSRNAESFWSTRVPGDTIVIEVWVPLDRNLGPDGFPFEIKYISHYFRESSGDASGLKASSIAVPKQNTCSFVNKIACTDDLYRTVAKLFYTEPSGNVAQCTASFLNSRSNQTYYLLTAFHCIHPGSLENMVRGSRINNARIETSQASCAAADEQLVGDEIRFIAASDKADWALLWVNEDSLQSQHGLPSAFLPHLLGWNTAVLDIGDSVETHHHTDGTPQNYAQLRVTDISYAGGKVSTTGDTTPFSSCRNPPGNCTHYTMEAITGGLDSGGSGASFWTNGQVRGVYTNGEGCDARVSRFDKVFEDGRVQCALTEGSAYYPDGTSSCNDSPRPRYSNPGGSNADDGGGGGGSTGLWFIIFLALSSLSLPNVWKRFISITKGATVPCYAMTASLISLISGYSSSS